MPEEDHLSDQDILRIIAKVCNEEPVRERLPGGGKLSIERKLPYLLIYRAEERLEPAAKLVLAESCYLVLPQDSQFLPAYHRLVQKLTQAMAKEMGSFLALEIWTSNDPGCTCFTIHAPEEGDHATVQALDKGLHQLKEIYPEATVEVVEEAERQPAGKEPLLTQQEAKKAGALFLGLEVPAIFQDPKSGDLYPRFLRRLRDRFSTVVREVLFSFLRVQTQASVTTFPALGRAQVDEAVWKIDRELADIETSYQFLLMVTPVNEHEAWEDFQASNFQREPEFHYRLLPMDPDVLKRRLWNLNIKDIDDPALAFLLRDKREALDKQLSMLNERGSPGFMYNSMRLYGSVSPELLQLAEGLLATINLKEVRAPSPTRMVGAEEFAQRAREEYDYYREQFPDFASRVIVHEDFAGLMVSRGNLLVPTSLQIPEDRVEGLLSHEVGTHVVTYYNGSAQPLLQLRNGLAGYDELQEGLAVLSEYLVGQLSEARMRLLAARVVACHSVLDGATFMETYHLLNDRYGFLPQSAFGIARRVYQGGGLLLDVVYLRGLVGLLKYLGKGGDFESLFIGKIAQKHIPVVKELRDREVLVDMPLKPRYLSYSSSCQRLKKVQQGLLVTSLIDKM